MNQSVVRIDPGIKARAEEIRCRDWPWLSSPGFLNLLLTQALDSGLTLGAPKGVNPQTPTLPGAPSYSSNSLIEEKGKTEKTFSTAKKAKRKNRTHSQLEANPQTGEFARFWSAYQASPHKTATQSKPRAWREWQLALEAGETSERIINGVSKAVQAGFAEFDGYRMPDAARWLREQRWLVFDADISAQAHPSREIL